MRYQLKFLCFLLLFFLWFLLSLLLLFSSSFYIIAYVFFYRASILFSLFQLVFAHKYVMAIRGSIGLYRELYSVIACCMCLCASVLTKAPVLIASFIFNVITPQKHTYTNKHHRLVHTIFANEWYTFPKTCERHIDFIVAQKWKWTIFYGRHTHTHTHSQS